MWKIMRYHSQGDGRLLEKVLPSTMIHASGLGAACVGLATGKFGWNERNPEGWIGNGKLRQMSEEYKNKTM